MSNDELPRATSGPALEVLDAAVPTHRQRWIELWSALPNAELFAHPDYVRLVARDVDQVLALAMVSGSAGALYPLVLRPLSAEEWARGEPYMDFVSPYGFGGPYCWSPTGTFAEEFWDAFDAWARRNNVVTGTARLSLFPDDILPLRSELRQVSRCVVRGLSETREEIWMSYDHKVRKNVKRARLANLNPKIDHEGSRLDDFIAIYIDTMTRRAASAFYHFSPRFFYRMFEALSDQIALAHVLDGKRVVASELLVVSSERVYSFLGGTRADAFSTRPNDLLKHEVVLWAKEQGKTVYVLGGGARDGDGIFRYKRSFAPGGVVPFHIACCTYDEDALSHLLMLREQSRPPGAPTPAELYFPPYRA